MCIRFRGNEVRVLTVLSSKRYYLSDKLVLVRRQKEKITSGDVMTCVPVRLSDRSLSFYYGKVPGPMHSSVREYKSAVFFSV